jgi:hypothetical protein
MRYGRSGH